MIILIGASGTLGNQIAKEIVKRKKNVLLTSNQRFTNISNSFSDNKYILNVKKCNIQIEKDLIDLFQFIANEKLEIDAIINNFAYSFDSKIEN